MTVVTVGARPEPFSGSARYVDGRQAMERSVTLAVDEDRQELLVRQGDDLLARWPLQDIRRLSDQADRNGAVLARRTGQPDRLIVEAAETLRLLQARCPDLDRRMPVRGKGRILAWAGAALGSVAAIILVLVPFLADRLAGLVPPRGEVALGEATYGRVLDALEVGLGMQVAACSNAEGDAALKAMTARLTDQVELPYPLRVTVLNHSLVNAFALPGGQVILFRGLIEAADDPDEVAAVLAHEIGHAAHRDPARAALRSAGSIGILGLVFGDFAGGALAVFLANQLIDAKYSRAAEAEADEYAQQMLLAAGISPSSLATFFEKLRAAGPELDDGLLAHFMSHPELGDRIAAARVAAGRMAAEARPSLTQNQWQALQDICKLGA